MKRVFLDTNILVDLIADRKPFSKFAIQIFSMGEAGKIKLYTSSHSVATTYYLLSKYAEEITLRATLYELMEFLSIVPVSEVILKKGLKSRHKDFEDAIQIFCAGTIDRLDCIVTRNIKDFKGSEIPVMSPDEFCLNLG